MAASSETKLELSGVGAQLQHYRTTVPANQRSFKWTTEHVEELLGDIDEAMDDDADEYFVGTMVVKDGDPAHDVLDGQQRLATMSLLLSVLVEELENLGEQARADGIRSNYLVRYDVDADEDLPRLKLNAEDDPYFRACIAGTAPEPDGSAPASHRLLFEARAGIQRWMHKHIERANSPDKWLLDLRRFVDEGVRAVRIRVSDEADAYRLFETLNDRGLDLTIADLLKNFLLSKAGGRHDSVLASWKRTIDGLLPFGGEERLPTYLRHYWSSKHEVVRDKDLYRKIREHIASRTRAVALATDLATDSYYYGATLSGDHEFWQGYPSSTRDSIRTLNELGLEQFRPLLLPALRLLTQQTVVDLVRRLVAWNVRLLVVGGGGGGVMESNYGRIGREIRDGRLKSVAAIGNQAIFIPRDDAFEARFATLSISKHSLARYYLARLEDAAVGNLELLPNPNTDELNLEHVLPKSPQGKWPDITPDEHDAFARRLGNLALLKADKNVALGNAAFSEKKKVLKESKLSLTAMIGTEKEWGPPQIVSRQQTLANLALKAWPISS